MTAFLLQNVGDATPKCVSQPLDSEKSVSETQPTTVTVPLPPSTNALFKTLRTGRRAKSAAYKDWLSEAGWRLKLQRPVKVPGRVVLLISVDRESMAADIDNRCKALIDLLVLHKVIDDDKHVTGLAIAWAAAELGDARVLITPTGPLTVRFLPEPSNHAVGGWYLIDPPTEEGAA